MGEALMDKDDRLKCLYRVVLREDIVLDKDYIGKFKKGLVRKGSYDIYMAIGDYAKNGRLMAFKKVAGKSLISCRIINQCVNLK